MSSPSRGSRAPFYPETPDFDIMRSVHIRNLYVHFPFCRAKCSYCALYSAAGRPESERNDYAMRLAEDVSRIAAEAPKPILMGRHLIAMGYQPSGQFGKWLSQAFEAQLDGAFCNLDGALAYFRREIVRTGAEAAEVAGVAAEEAKEELA